MTKIIITILFITLVACSSKKGPEQVLREYINYRFSQHQNKAEILKKTTGNLQEHINAQTDEDFQNFGEAIRDFKKKRVKVNLKKCNETSCSITYTVIYDIVKNDNKEHAIEVKKIAIIEKVDEEWRIADVTNLKTYIENSDMQIQEK